MIDLSAAEKHSRYLMQAEWTKPFRDHLFSGIGNTGRLHVLEVGCGTGAVLSEIKRDHADIIEGIAGVDIDRKSLTYAKFRNDMEFIQTNGTVLPFADSCFDLVFCHFFLLWIKDPIEILAEMKRVTKPGGVCAAMAEPCYAEMRAVPKELFELADKQRKILSGLGADMAVGSQLDVIFEKAGFTAIEFGKYREIKSSPDYIYSEIRQMLIDTHTKDFRIDKKAEYSYSVPTYFAFAKNNKVA